MSWGPEEVLASQELHCCIESISFSLLCSITGARTSSTGASHYERSGIYKETKNTLLAALIANRGYL